MDTEPINVDSHDSLMFIFTPPQLPHRRTLRSSKGYLASRLVEPPYADFLCGACNGVVKNPIECENCGALYCNNCALPCDVQGASFSMRSNEIHCKKCQVSGAPRRPSLLLKRMIGDLKIRCKYSECAAVLPLSGIKIHQRECGYKEVQCANYDKCKRRGMVKDLVVMKIEASAHMRLSHFNRRFACSEGCKRLVEFDRMTKKKDRQGVLRAYQQLLLEIEKSK